MDRLKVKDWVKVNAIGWGFYEVVNINDFHINLKCLKLFGKGTDHRGHVTNIHHGINKETGARIPINQKDWLDCKVQRLSNKP